jgi:hypothetical protein
MKMPDRMVKWIKWPQNSSTASYKFSEITAKKKKIKKERKSILSENS